MVQRTTLFDRNDFYNIILSFQRKYIIFLLLLSLCGWQAFIFFYYYFLLILITQFVKEEEREKEKNNSCGFPT